MYGELGVVYLTASDLLFGPSIRISHWWRNQHEI
nr:MAG TPA: hypothetical protein [Caudoviricetes sp.]